LGAVAVNSLDQINGSLVELVIDRGPAALAADHAYQPVSAHHRSIVQRAMPAPSPWSCHHTLRAP